MRTPTGSTTRAAGGHDGEAVAPKGQGAKRRSASPSRHHLAITRSGTRPAPQIRCAPVCRGKSEVNLTRSFG
jgi:hypothetical protein